MDRRYWSIGIGSARACRRIAARVAFLLTVASPLFTAGALAQTPLGPAFTFQGQLNDGGAPADGSYDLRFTLYNDTVAVGGPICRDNVQVTAGLFIVQLDFGFSVFSGETRSLEVAVRPGGAAGDCGIGAYTPLSPRQPLTPTPYAIFARNSRWGGLLDVPAGFADGVDNAGGVTLPYSGSANVSGPAFDVANSSATGTGLLGRHTATTGTSAGAQGVTNSTDGNAVGVLGEVSAISAGSYSSAVRGVNNGTGTSGIGVWGSQAGSGWGVYGTSARHTGVRGDVTAVNPDATSAGVRGVNNGTGADGIGVWGSQNGSGLGVYGTSATGVGIRGLATSTTGSGIGVWGSQNGTGWGVYGLADGIGVFGESDTGTGVRGRHSALSGTAAGVHGLTSSTDAQAVGVLGEVTSSSSSAQSAGVRGINNGDGYGVWGYTVGSGFGVYGRALGSGGIGVYGTCNLDASSWGGYFSGRVHVNGTLSKAAGSFKIDHPLDPANKYLSHSFVESPDMMNIYNGVVTTDERGYATVELPDFFEALNRDFRYQLTIIDQANSDDFVLAKVVREVEANRFSICTSAPGTKVSWLVTGIRHDPYAEAHRIPVEENKPEVERGKYLRPALYGQPPEMGMKYQPESPRTEPERPSPLPDASPR